MLINCCCLYTSRVFHQSVKSKVRMPLKIFWLSRSSHDGLYQNRIAKIKLSENNIDEQGKKYIRIIYFERHFKFFIHLFRWSNNVQHWFAWFELTSAIYFVTMINSSSTCRWRRTATPAIGDDGIEKKQYQKNKSPYYKVWEMLILTRIYSYKYIDQILAIHFDLRHLHLFFH